MFLDKVKEFSFNLLSKTSLPPIEIFVRHCHFSDVSAHKKRPGWFSRRACFDNLITTVRDQKKINLTILLDTSRPMQGKHFVHEQSLYPVVETNQGTEGGSFCFMMDLVLSKKFSDDTIIYFLEDDYLHRKGWVDVLREGIALDGADYVTLYDHRDKYFLQDYKELASKLFVTQTTHWRQTPSTTNTFAMRYKTLRSHADIHYKYSLGKKISEDHAKFVELSQKGSMLISPLPGWSCHLEPDFMSPCVDWQKVQDETSIDCLAT